MPASDPTALDRPWRFWASIIIVSILAFSVVFGFFVIPVVQGYSAGIDPFSAHAAAAERGQGPANNAGGLEPGLATQPVPPR